MSSTQLSPADLEARNKLIDEHVQSEIAHDVPRTMKTWGKNPWFDDVGWEEKSYGHDEIEAHYNELMSAFPDLGIEVHKRHVTDEAIILEMTVTGTHLGQWRDLPPLGRKISSRVCGVYVFDEDGMLELERTYYDKAIVLEQLGMFADPRQTKGKVIAALTPPFSILRALLRRGRRRK
jgi:steroid delta-isomerase-like uncharacterized protein